MHEIHMRPNASLMDALYDTSHGCLALLLRQNYSCICAFLHCCPRNRAKYLRCKRLYIWIPKMSAAAATRARPKLCAPICTRLTMHAHAWIFSHQSTYVFCLQNSAQARLNGAHATRVSSDGVLRLQRETSVTVHTPNLTLEDIHTLTTPVARATFTQPWWPATPTSPPTLICAQYVVTVGYPFEEITTSGCSLQGVVLLVFLLTHQDTDSSLIRLPTYLYICDDVSPPTCTHATFRCA